MAWFLAKTVQPLTRISSQGFLEKIRRENKATRKGKKVKHNISVKMTNRNYRCVQDEETEIRKLWGTFGESGYRSRYLPHAKRALYHLS